MSIICPACGSCVIASDPLDIKNLMELKSQLAAAQQDNTRLRGILERIEKSEHITKAGCTYSIGPLHSAGMCAGHKCCAAIAAEGRK